MDKASRGPSYVYKREFRYVRTRIEINARSPVVLCGTQATLSWFYSFFAVYFFLFGLTCNYNAVYPLSLLK